MYKILEEYDDRGYSDIVSWQDHGRSFRVIDVDCFVSQVMHRFFKQTKFRSFQRQLSLYGFNRIINKGKDFGYYYHENFRRQNLSLVFHITRTAVKGIVCAEEPIQQHQNTTVTDFRSTKSPVNTLTPSSTMILMLTNNNQHQCMSDIEVNQEDSRQHYLPWDDACW